MSDQDKVVRVGTGFVRLVRHRDGREEAFPAREDEYLAYTRREAEAAAQRELDKFSAPLGMGADGRPVSEAEVARVRSWLYPERK